MDGYDGELWTLGIAFMFWVQTTECSVVVGVWWAVYPE